MPTIAASARPAIVDAVIARWRSILIVSVFALGLAARFVAGWDAPFWVDETFSGVIASQRSVSGLIGWCLNELTGPGYYMPLWAWEKLAGPSDVALRLPSLFASLAAPALLLWRGHPDRDIRFVWAVSAALWVPGFVFAGDARPYALLFLLGAVQAILFLRLMRTPGIATALAWTSVSAFFVLTHYHSVVVTGLQGLAYLALHRRAALRTWPALAPLVPMGVWMTLHLPFVLGFANSGAWYETLDLVDVLLAPNILFGSEVQGTLILVVIGATLVRWLANGRRNPIGWATPEAMLALTGIAAFLVIYGMAFLRPSFSTRYLTSTMPAVLFGVALWGRWSLRGRGGAIDPKPLLLVMTLMTIMAIGEIRLVLDHPEDDFRRQFNIERASQWLLERPPARLIFYWESAATDVADPVRLAEVGNFFLARAGHFAVTTVPRIPKHVDPNAAIAARTEGDRNVAVLWTLTDRAVGQMQRYPHLDRDRRWECRDFGGGTTVVMACRRRREA